jgi:hypothetical protein
MADAQHRRLVEMTADDSGSPVSSNDSAGWPVRFKGRIYIGRRLSK